MLTELLSIDENLHGMASRHHSQERPLATLQELFIRADVNAEKIVNVSIINIASSDQRFQKVLTL